MIVNSTRAEPEKSTTSIWIDWMTTNTSEDDMDNVTLYNNTVNIGHLLRLEAQKAGRGFKAKLKMLMAKKSAERIQTRNHNLLPKGPGTRTS